VGLTIRYPSIVAFFGGPIDLQFIALESRKEFLEVLKKKVFGNPENSRNFPYGIIPINEAIDMPMMYRISAIPESIITAALNHRSCPYCIYAY
jgi:hypothetical protein